MKASIITTVVIGVSFVKCSGLKEPENEKPKNFDDLNPQLWSLIGSFQGNPYKNIPLVNRTTSELSSRIPLNSFLSYNFDIKEIKDFEGCENELKHVLDLINFSNLKHVFFLALAIDIFEKKRFSKTEKPLTLYLARILQNFDFRTSLRHLSYKYNVNNALMRYKEYDYIIDVMEANIRNFQCRLIKSINSNVLLQHLSPYYLDKFETELSKLTGYYKKTLTALGLRFGDTERFFREALNKRGPEFMVGALMSLVTDCEASENRESASQLVEDLLNRFKQADPQFYYSNRELFAYIEVLNKIYHDHEDPEFYNREIQPRAFSESVLYKISEGAFKAGKLGLFDEIFHKAAPLIQHSIINDINNHRNCDEDSPSQFYFYALNLMTNDERVQCFLRTELFKVAMYHYEMSGFDISLNRSKVTITLKAPVNEVEKGYPEFLISTFAFPAEIKWNLLMRTLRVSNSKVFEIFLKSYIMLYSYSSLEREISFDAIKMILESAELVKFVKSYRVLFTLNTKTLSKFLKDSTLDISELRNITLELRKFVFNDVLPTLTTESELFRMELVTDRSIADLYVIYSEHLGSPQAEYFRARQLFDYWLKGPHRERIATIGSSELKEMIAMEHPVHRALIMAAVATERVFSDFIENDHDEL